jgi:hypothetical protein
MLAQQDGSFNDCLRTSCDAADSTYCALTGFWLKLLLVHVAMLVV